MLGGMPDFMQDFVQDFTPDVTETTRRRCRIA